jgi:hypothetical protein
MRSARNQTAPTETVPALEAWFGTPQETCMARQPAEAMRAVEETVAAWSSSLMQMVLKRSCTLSLGEMMGTSLKLE